MNGDTKKEIYRQALAELDAVLAGVDDPITAMATCACVLHQKLPYASWTGFYRVVAPGLGPWTADQLAPYFAANYHVVDRAEVYYYMGRLGLTLRDVLLDPSARLCLARAMGVLPQSMTELIAPLEQRGSIVRRHDPANARILRIELTAEGERLFARGTEIAIRTLRSCDATRSFTQSKKVWIWSAFRLESKSCSI